MSFCHCIFCTCTHSIVLLLSIMWVRVKLRTLVMGIEGITYNWGFSGSGDFVNKFLVLVFFLCMSALCFQWICHQEVSLLSFKAWQQGCSLFNISFARLLKAHMHQRNLGVNAIILVCGFVDVFSGCFYVILILQGRCNFFSGCIYVHVNMEVSLFFGHISWNPVFCVLILFLWKWSTLCFSCSISH